MTKSFIDFNLVFPVRDEGERKVRHGLIGRIAMIALPSLSLTFFSLRDLKKIVSFGLMEKDAETKEEVVEEAGNFNELKNLY